MTRKDWKVAVHAIAWGNDHMRALEEASALGFTAFEPWADFILRYEDKVDVFERLMSTYGLEISSVYGGGLAGEGRLSNPAAREDLICYNERLARLLSRLGVQRIMIGPGERTPGGMSHAELAEAAVTLNQIAETTMKYGVLSCLHPHIGTEIQDEQEIEAVLNLADPDLVGFAPDTAHLTIAGMNASDMIRRHGKRAAHVHLKDLTPKAAIVDASAAGRPWHPFCELGRGTIDFQPVLSALEDIGYRGFLTVEVDQSAGTPWDSLVICRDFVRNELGMPIANAP